MVGLVLLVVELVVEFVVTTTAADLNAVLLQRLEGIYLA